MFVYAISSRYYCYEVTGNIVIVFIINAQTWTFMCFRLNSVMNFCY